MSSEGMAGDVYYSDEDENYYILRKSGNPASNGWYFSLVMTQIGSAQVKTRASLTQLKVGMSTANQVHYIMTVIMDF